MVHRRIRAHNDARRRTEFVHIMMRAEFVHIMMPALSASENAFSSCIASSSGELTCPRGNPAEKRFLLSAAALLLYRMTSLRGVLWNAIAICLNTWHECAPPACAPEGEALASAEAHAPKGASPSPRPETPTRRHPSMHAPLTPHLGLGRP